MPTPLRRTERTGVMLRRLRGSNRPSISPPRLTLCPSSDKRTLHHPSSQTLLYRRRRMELLKKNDRDLSNIPGRPKT